MATLGTRPKTRKKETPHPKVNTIIQVIVLLWCGVVLTASWASGQKHADSTFVAGVFTSVLANFGILAARKEEEEAFKRGTQTSLPPKDTP